MQVEARLCECGSRIEKKPGRGRWPHRCADCRAPKGSQRYTCDFCRGEFEAKRSRRYCAPRCKSKAYHQATVTDGRAAARYAAAKADGSYEAWKAERRRKTAETRAAECCPVCAGPMAPRKRAHCGKPECARAQRNAYMREYLRTRSAEFRARGESYRGQWRTPEQRAALDALQADPEKARARRQEGWQRRRARKKATQVESFRHVDVFERDGWVCALCGRDVDRELRHPHPLSASLDHRRPLALGGTHTLSNVQLAHLVCNVSRQTKPIPGEVDDYVADAAEEAG